MEKPAIHDFGFLTELNDDWMIILAQIVLHKRGTADKLGKVLGMEQVEITHYFNSMLMAGVLVERNTDLFIIDAYLHNEICEVLALNELI